MAETRVTETGSMLRSEPKGLYVLHFVEESELSWGWWRRLVRELVSKGIWKQDKPLPVKEC